MKLRDVALQRKLKLQKVPLQNEAFPTMLALFVPRLEHLGDVGLDELVMDLNGGPMDGVQGHELYDAASAVLSGGDNLSLASLAGQERVDMALELLEGQLLKESQHLEENPPEGFRDLVQALLNGVSTRGILRSNRFIVRCGMCSRQLQDQWLNCPICDDYDICTDCFTRNDCNHKHELEFARQADVSNKINQLRQLLFSIQGGAFTIFDARGAYTFCDGCHRRPGNGIHYSCKQCENFDLCRRCLIDPTKRGHHGTHEFVPAKAALLFPEAVLPASPTIHLPLPPSASHPQDTSSQGHD